MFMTMRRRDNVSSISITGKVFITTFVLLTIVPVVESIFIRTQSFVASENLAGLGLLLFLAFGTIFAVGQFIALKRIGRIALIKRKAQFYILHEAVTIGQYVLVFIFVMLVFQVYFFHFYSTLLVLIGSIVSYAMAIVNLGFLAFLFLKWFKSNREHIILLYGISAAMLAINISISVIFTSALIHGVPSEIRQHSIGMVPPFNSSALSDMMYSVYAFTNVISFILAWVSTSVLLSRYSRRLGTAVSWLMLSIPLVFFLLQFQPFLTNIFSPILRSDPIVFSILYTVVFTVIRPIGAILFGLAFWVMAKQVKGEMDLKNLLVLSGFAFILIFISNQPTLFIFVPFPPLGYATFSIAGLSGYVLLTAVYSSAISVAVNREIRNKIRRIALNESKKLLGGIGLAEMEQEIANKVFKLTVEDTETLANEIGVGPAMSEVEVKEYLAQVIQEIKKDSDANSGS